MPLRKTKLRNVISVTGISTVGIFTAGATPTDVGTAQTSYIRSIILHNTGLSACTASIFVNPDLNPVTSANLVQNRIARIDLSSNETYFFETNYPIVLTPTDSISVSVEAPSSGGSGIGSVVNVLINGDTDI
jgi:hypothetical protein